MATPKDIRPEGKHPGPGEAGRGGLVNDLELQRRALELWSKKLTQPEIGRALGVTAWVAGRLVQRGLERTGKTEADKRRRQDVEALDHLERMAWAGAANPGYQVALSGRVVMDPVTHQPLVDHEQRRRYMETIIHVHERRAKLIGEDAPAQSKVEVSFEGFLAVVERMEAQADELEAAIDVDSAEVDEDDEGTPPALSA